MSNKYGDKKIFDNNWQNRPETLYNHWTKNAPVNQVQLAFRKHYELFKEIIKSYDTHEVRKVLEVGCGRGSLSSYFSAAGCECTLLDSSEHIISVAKEIFHANNLSAEFVVGDALKLPFAENEFDFTFSIGLLEHFTDPSIPIMEQIRVLRPGGIFIGYIVPEYKDSIQKNYKWINDILKEYKKTEESDVPQKDDVYRNPFDSAYYEKVLGQNNVVHIQSSGVYSVPMISHSIDFPFSLMPPVAEEILVKELQNMIDENKRNTGKNGWLCDEGYGQALLVWGQKK
jgi:ubiquinone/menaquinone biosynthesis C-methylase UbiE